METDKHISGSVESSTAEVLRELGEWYEGFRDHRGPQKANEGLVDAE